MAEVRICQLSPCTQPGKLANVCTSGMCWACGGVKHKPRSVRFIRSAPSNPTLKSTDAPDTPKKMTVLQLPLKSDSLSCVRCGKPANSLKHNQMCRTCGNKIDTWRMIS